LNFLFGSTGRDQPKEVVGKFYQSVKDYNQCLLSTVICEWKINSVKSKAEDPSTKGSPEDAFISKSTDEYVYNLIKCCDNGCIRETFASIVQDFNQKSSAIEHILIPPTPSEPKPKNDYLPDVFG
jgi:hypothetical protein